jgi:hypothetical protein
MRRLLVALSGLFVLAACGGGGTATASPSTGITFTMGAQNGSGVSGTGTIVPGTGAFTVTIKLKGMAPGSSHVSHVHLGSCAKPGSIQYALQEVVADSSGAATTTSSVVVGYTVPTSGWYVNVHHGPDLSVPANGPSISCGDLPPA